MKVAAIFIFLVALVSIATSSAVPGNDSWNDEEIVNLDVNLEATSSIKPHLQETPRDDMTLKDWLIISGFFAILALVVSIIVFAALGGFSKFGESWPRLLMSTGAALGVVAVIFVISFCSSRFDQISEKID